MKGGVWVQLLPSEAPHAARMPPVCLPYAALARCLQTQIDRHMQAATATTKQLACAPMLEPGLRTSQGCSG